MRAIPPPKVSAALLHGVAQTCLIPLRLRADDARARSPILGDARAPEIAANVDADWSALRIPAPSARAALVRARAIDRRVESFLAEGGRTAVLSIGSGLDTRMTRLPSRPAVWIDLELPEVAALRRPLIPDEGPATTIAGSFLEAEWLEQVRPRLDGARILLVAEGVLNYLPSASLARAFQQTSAALGPCTLVADVMSRFFAEEARFLGAIRRTGAGIEWGASSEAACERLLGVRVRSLEVYLHPDDRALGLSRHMYRVPIFRDMSRILVAELGTGPSR